MHSPTKAIFLALTGGLIFFGQLFSAPPASAGEEAAAITEAGRQSLTATVLIHTHAPERDRHFQASGFFINEKGMVVTNHHVVEGAARIAVQTMDGRFYRVRKILAADIESDLVLLDVDLRGAAVAPLAVAADLPERETRIAVVGNPDGKQGVVSTGRISSVLQVPGYGPLLQITAPIASGSSGSPVVNEKREVVGVATFRLTNTENFNFSIPAARVAALLAAHSREAAPAETTPGDGAAATSDLDPGKKALEANDYEQALALFSALLEKQETAARNGWRGWELWFYLGRAYGGLGRNEEAAAAFQKAAELMPDLAVIHYNLGVAHSQSGDLRTAAAAFKRATALSPEMAEAHFNLGIVCMVEEDAACVREKLQLLRQLDPGLAGLFLRRLHGGR